MSGTKQKILSASLTLFNSHGISNVPLRRIANDLEISVGNLQYHYKKREEIIEALYFQLVSEIDAIYVIPGENILKSAIEIPIKVFETLYEYRFFLLDFISITRNNRKIKQHYAELSKQRELMFLELTKLLIQNNIIRKEQLNGEYSNLFKRVETLSNFWFSSILIQSDTLSKASIQSYAVTVSQCLFPYLTKEARMEYMRMYPEQVID